MPFKPPETKKCPACSQSVYAAEERKAGDEKYHKMCFKCMMCNKMLELSNYAPHENGKQIFCKQCHGRKYGPKGVGFGVGAGCMSTDTGKQFDAGSSLLNPYVSYNGGISPGGGNISSGRSTPGPRYYNYSSSAPGYHFLPYGLQPDYSSGGNPQYSSGEQSYGGADDRGGQYSYKSSFQKYSNQWGGDYHGFGTEGYNPRLFGGAKNWQLQNMGSSMMGNDSGVERASLPGVYNARKVYSDSDQWARASVTDNAAKQKAVDTLTVTIPSQSDYGQTVPIYNAQSPPVPKSTFIPISPRPLYTSRAYHPRGYGSSIAGDRCPRCSKPVYAAERRVSQGAAWHRQCFTCRCCHTSLDSTNCCDANYEIWCKTCHNRFFGIKGVGFGVGAGVLTTRK